MNCLPRLDALPELLARADLTGVTGTNRCPDQRPRIPAQNDYDAIHAWLAEYAHKKTTYQSYRKEAERLLLWCVLQAKKPLSSLNREDFEAYKAFLEDPQPQRMWCKKKGGYGIKRGEAGWKPFEGPLGASATRTALSILTSLMSYLCEARYLASNPWVLMRRHGPRRAPVDEQKLCLHERRLDAAQWEVLIQTLEEWPEATRADNDEKVRLKWLVGLLFFLGLRVNEVSTGHWCAFQKIEERWWFMVKGKGEQGTKIPVNAALLGVMLDYRLHFEMPLYPSAEETTPLIFSLRNRTKAIGNRQIHQLIKRVGHKAAEKFHDDAAMQQKFHQLSPRVLRHSLAFVQEKQGEKKR